MTPNHHHPEYRPPEPPTGWHDQDWLLILIALDWYARDGPNDVTEGQELRAYQLVESIAQLHGPFRSGAFDASTAATSSSTLIGPAQNSSETL